jgi:cysteinyl-tRNA synthetase
LLTKSYKNDVDYIDDEILTLKKDFINLHMFYNKLSNKFYHPNKNEKLNYSGQIEIYEKILEIISDNFNVYDAIREFMKYIDKFMKVYLTSDYADKILDELDKVNNLFNILDKSLLTIDSDTMKLIAEREELRKLKQFQKTDAIREQIKLTYIFEDENTGFTLIKKLD